MKYDRCLDQDELIERGLDVLFDELGPVDARRFIAIAHGTRGEDSVKRHRQWQAGLDKEAFVKRIMAIQRGKKR